MQQTICSRVEFILPENVGFQSGNIISLNSGKNWIPILNQGQPVYSNQQDDSDAGKLNTESVKVPSLSTDNDCLTSIANLGKRVLVRCWTNNGFFIVGSKVLPCSIVYTDDKSTRTFTFSTKSPAK
jgi:hypothetical protein